MTFLPSAAESYAFHGEQWILTGGTPIVNHSGLLQVFHNDMQFALSGGSVYTAVFDSGEGGILWTGDSMRGTTGLITVEKTGRGELTLTGHHEGIDRIVIEEGELVLTDSFSYTNTHATALFALSFQGGSLRAVGAATGTSEVYAGQIGHTSPGSLVGFATTRNTRIIVDTNGGAGTTLVFDDWSVSDGLGASNGSLERATVTVYFDLSAQGSTVKVGAENFSGVDGVVPFAAVTDASGTTGFVQLAPAAGGGYEVVRLDPTTVLPTTGSWSSTTNYQVTLSESNPLHVYEVGTPGSVVPEVGSSFNWTTLTLRGTGTLRAQERYLRSSYLLLEEGIGDFIIDGLGLVDSGRTSSRVGPPMRLFSYRDPQQGRLVIETKHFGWVNTSGDSNPAGFNRDPATYMTLAKAGHGTVVFRSANTNIIGLLAVQEGRMQVESDGFRVTHQIEVYDGVLGGSGQIGGGDRWVREGSTNVNKTALNPSDILYSSVRIDYGGTLDATPAEHAVHDGLRGLQIYGSLTMEEGATFAMTLNAAVLSGDYNPLRVTAKDPLSTAVTLAGDLLLVLQDQPTNGDPILLLVSNGLIGGAFSTVNGNPFGPDGHFILSFAGMDYDFFLRHEEDVGGMVLYVAIPEPSAVALLMGAVAVIGFLRVRRKKVLCEVAD